MKRRALNVTSSVFHFDPPSSVPLGVKLVLLIPFLLMLLVPLLLQIQRLGKHESEEEGEEEILV